jgi:hypothetical protein
MTRLIHLTVATMVAGVFAAGVASAEPAPTLHWQPCADNTEIECASLTVPIDWSRPRDGTIEVAVARRAGLSGWSARPWGPASCRKTTSPTPNCVGAAPAGASSQQEPWSTTWNPAP